MKDPISLNFEHPITQQAEDLPENRYRIDWEQVPSPCFVLEERLLRRNLELLNHVQQEADVKIILALKAFSMWSAFPMVREYLSGATASSLHEARLVYEEMGVRPHVYQPVYMPEHFPQILDIASHITFNSLGEWNRYKEQVAQHERDIPCALRINPEYSEVGTSLYNPCSPGSRMGITAEQLGDELPEGITGLHFHTLCESDSYALEKTLQVIEERFAQPLQQAQWVNMGGGHLMTRKGYDVEHVIKVLKRFRERHNVEVIMEPGSAVAWQTGVLTATVLDVIEANRIKTAMLNVSFTAHMPDTLEMPYQPHILGAREPQEGDRHIYRLGGTTCLSGDFKGDYAFPGPLQPGNCIILDDMIHYTMVKTTTFNGVPHPSIGIWTKGNEFRLVKEFQYEDFKSRLS